MRTLLVIALVAAAALAVGCDRARQSLGLKRPVSSGPAPTTLPGGGQAGKEEVNPVAAGANAEKPVARPATAAESAEPVTRSQRPAKYEARLEEVPIPLPGGRPPVMTMLETPKGATPQLVNTVLAQVNGEVITREDVLGPIRPQMEQWRTQYPASEFEDRCREVIAMKLRQMISQRLVIQEAKAGLSDKEKEEIEAQLGQTVKNMAAQAGSAQRLDEQLKTEGSTVEDEKRIERERMIVQRFLREKIAPTIHVTHGELLARYHELQAEKYTQVTRVRLGLMAIKKSESASAEQAGALAQAVHERAKGGEDFAKLAERYSQDPMASKGGDWGFLGQGAFRIKEVDAALFPLKEGDVAPLVETADTFYIVKALERQEGRVVPFTEVQDDIEDDIRDRKYNETVSKYVQKLYERGYVRIIRENL